MSSALGVDSRSSRTITNKNYNAGTGGSSSGNTNGNTNNSGGGSTGQTGSNPWHTDTNYVTSPVSAASMQAQGWENTLYLSLFMFVFFAYRYTPNAVRY